MEKLNNKQTGNKGEDMAAEYLQQLGYEIIERNYRFGKGEIDIIIFDKETGYTAFVEVKYRKNLEYGEPEYAITNSKKSQVRRIAAAYLQEKELTDTDCRFDAVTILDLPGKKAVINHYIGAFM